MVMSTKRLIIYTDGGSRGNPGPGALGVVIEDESGHSITQISRRIGETTNNRAEYLAIIAGLDEAARLGAVDVEVRSDSELLVKQISGQYRVRHPELKPLFEQVHYLIGRFQSFRIVHIPRGRNKAAHALSHSALRRAKD